MPIVKSSRHSKITGDFAEALVLYWLSRDGFECARIDHTGIDLIARNRHTDELLGISVKCRSRAEGTATDSVNLPRDGFAKARTACDAFRCIPYFAIVVDDAQSIQCFILPLQHLEHLCGGGGDTAYWRMTIEQVSQYLSDPEVKAFHLRIATSSWWQNDL